MTNFDIRDYVGNLQLVDEDSSTTYFACPVCECDRLGVAKTNGAYSCLKKGCDSKEIARLITKGTNSSTKPNRTRFNNSANPKTYVNLINRFTDVELKLPTITPEVSSDAPSKSKCRHKAKKGQFKDHEVEAERIDYLYSDTQLVSRFEWKDSSNKKGREKDFRQCHKNSEGEIVFKKGDIPWKAYREIESLNAIQETNANIFLIQEGEKSVELLRKFGHIPSITLQGGAWNKDAVTLAERIREQSPSVLTVMLADADEAGDKKASILSKAFQNNGLAFVVVNARDIYPEICEKGDIEQILEYLNYDLEKFESKLFDQIKSLITSKLSEPVTTDLNPKESKGSNSKDDPQMVRQFKAIKGLLGDRIRYNQLFQQIELDGVPFEIDKAQYYLVVEHGIEISKAWAQDLLLNLSKENSYHPVEEYLNNVHTTYRGDEHLLNNIASKYFGSNSNLHNTYLRKFLISAVARALSPQPTKVDTVLILKGAQGFYKSTFFKVLAGKDWFDDSVGDESDKDRAQKLNRAFITEWGELENVYKRKDVSQIKAFLSTEVDRVRLPYERGISNLVRRGVIVGSTNKDEFLNDPTGDRRFWVIEVNQPINYEKVAEDRDRLWAAAVNAYKNGAEWWLSAEEQQLSASGNELFRGLHPWHETINVYCSNKESVTVEEILCLIKPEVKERTQADKNAVVDILKLLKYKLKRTSSKRYYERISDGLCDGNDSLGDSLTVTDQSPTMTGIDLPNDGSDGQITPNLNRDESSSDSFRPILLEGNSMDSKYNFNKKTVITVTTVTKPLESSDSNTFKNDGLVTVSPSKDIRPSLESQKNVADFLQDIGDVEKTLKVGDRVRYLGKQSKVAQDKDLTIISIDGDTAKVTNGTWIVEPSLPLSDLVKKLESTLKASKSLLHIDIGTPIVLERDRVIGLAEVTQVINSSTVQVHWYYRPPNVTQKVLIADIEIATGDNLKKLEIMKRRFPKNTGTCKAS